MRAGERGLIIRFSQLELWAMPRQSLISDVPAGWRLVKIGDVARLAGERVRVEPDKAYNMTGVKWYGEGVFARETVLGKEMSANSVTPLIPGALIYNRLFAWKGSFAVVPDDFGEQYVSNEFPQFIVDSNQVLPAYLYLYCMTSKVIEAVNRASAGSAAVSRNRLKESVFLDIDFLLPPLEVQQAIVQKWREARAAAEEALALADRLEEEAVGVFVKGLGLTGPRQIGHRKAFGVYWTEFDRWGVDSNAQKTSGLKLDSGPFPVREFGEISKISYGIQKSPANRPGIHARPYLRVANVQRGFLDLTEIKEINVPDAEFFRFKLEPNDVLFVEGNGSRKELGRVAVWKGEIENCVHQNHIIKARLDLEFALPGFVMEWFNTEIGRQHFFRSAKTTSGLGTINSQEIRQAPIVLPPLDVQQVLVEAVRQARQQAAAARAQAEALKTHAAAEIEAAILGHAAPVPEALSAA